MIIKKRNKKAICWKTPKIRSHVDIGLSDHSGCDFAIKDTLVLSIWVNTVVKWASKNLRILVEKKNSSRRKKKSENLSMEVVTAN